MLNVILILGGLVALFYGADFLVKGAARLASSFGVSPLVIGLTLVAFGTSTPELLVSLTAALRGSTDIALGNVIGSNIVNIGLILGVTGLIFPVVVNSQVLRRELPLMFGVSVLTYLLALDGSVGRPDGLLLVLGFALFTGLTYRLARRAEQQGDTAAAEYTEFEESEGLLDVPQVNRLLEVGRAIIGVAILMAGSQFLVRGATSLALALGISEAVIGLTLVAFGTSLPELATSLVSALRKEDDISVGNVIGSNLFNLLAVLGPTAVLLPIPVAPTLVRFDLPVMLAFALGLWALVRNGRLERWQGALLLVSYLAFTIYLFVR